MLLHREINGIEAFHQHEFGLGIDFERKAARTRRHRLCCKIHRDVIAKLVDELRLENDRDNAVANAIVSRSVVAIGAMPYHKQADFV